MTANHQIHFEVSERKILLRVVDILFVLMFLHIVGSLFDFHYFTISPVNYYWTLVLSLYLLFFGTVFEMYNLQVASNQYQIIKSTVLTTSLTVLVYLLTPKITPALPENRLQIFLFYLSIFSSLLFWRMIYVKFIASNRFWKRAIFICHQNELPELAMSLQKTDPHFKVVGFINLSAAHTMKFKDVDTIELKDLEDYLQNNYVSEIVIASQKTENITVDLYNVLIKLLENGISIREYTQVYESITHRIPVQYVAQDFYKYFPFSRSNQNKLYLIFVRSVEIALSLLGLTIGLLISPVILLGNLLGNRGSLLYTQERVGKNGKAFKIYKLRSMVKDAEKNGAVFATSNDVRVTAFGKILRKSRLDEVPQFINVLKGDMAIIGPRPERPVFVKEIAAMMPFYETRHVVKPGLTGWAQVNYSYGETLQDSLIKLQYDLYYIKHRSLFLDLNIMVKTISTVLFYRGQ
ncbi:exopolysaccharide biosynthesis polyprenyl glycosylphosphotransferase [Flavobacterium amniphilum]|uniref:exopolysaccharide biosynthesis polyprenyl glycosylphosphotransferase n=1 Tax=Flavobacterium amniphilum TaxID=1834035 RepID=UPI00202AB13F|nr:exopolysaccharide biosynthesis polyprenyl glycosylphosphotransferase [Flavobacterium amniphilum]MCL9805090.1 exopolysaccharide biosynthesis polyprenyl glycosylphosphotransferase [Flavobacterium amniphilum]